MTASTRLPRDGLKLRKLALAYPEAYEELPSGHHAIKVKGKSFLFLAADRETFSLSAKLPSSGDVAVKPPFASPTEYGLGRSGWVTARIPRAAKIPVKTLELWIEESYRAIAPKRLLRALLILLLITIGGLAPPSRRPGWHPTIWSSTATLQMLHFG
jgi:predicted DNA-binding protein (MmcQ/YjbR family)